MTADIDYDNPMDHAEGAEWITDNRPAFMGALLGAVYRAHRQEPVYLFFRYFYNSCITPEAVKEIWDLSIMTVNFSCNNVHQFRLVREIAPAYQDELIKNVKGYLRKFQLQPRIVENYFLGKHVRYDTACYENS